MIASGVGGRYPSELCGRIVLYSLYCKHSDRTSVFGPTSYGVVSPHMAFTFWLQPDD
jgi:hypothetical protein